MVLFLENIKVIIMENEEFENEILPLSDEKFTDELELTEEEEESLENCLSEYDECTNSDYINLVARYKDI